MEILKFAVKKIYRSYGDTILDSKNIEIISSEECLPSLLCNILQKYHPLQYSKIILKTICIRNDL